MPFKINMSSKDGKTFKIESESEEIVGKELGDKIKGNEISPELAGYEFEITGASDGAGLTALKEVDGIALKKVLLGFGKAMHKKSKGLRKKRRKPQKGLKLRKTVRGKVISPAIVQINMKVLKQGSKSLKEIFPDQNKPKEKKESEETKPSE